MYLIRWPACINLYQSRGIHSDTNRKDVSTGPGNIRITGNMYQSVSMEGNLDEARSRRNPLPSL